MKHLYACGGSPSLQVVLQQKAECSHKLEDLRAWLAGAAATLANQKVESTEESDDVSVLQDRQKKLKVQNLK